MHPNQPLLLVLPMEIRNMIYLDLSRHDMVQLLKTCRTLFHLTIPFVWHKADVELAILLRMLPGCRECSQAEGGLEIVALEQLPDNYFDRVRLYTPYVETLRVCLNYNVSGTSIEEPNFSMLVSRVSLKPLTPRLWRLKLLLPDSAELTLNQGYRLWLQLFDSAASIRSLTTQNLCFDNAQVSHPDLPHKRDSGGPSEDARFTGLGAVFPLDILLDLHKMPLRDLKIRRTVVSHSGRSIYENIADLWPNLDFLCVRSPVEIQELFDIRNHFPKLAKLHAQPFNRCLEELEGVSINETATSKRLAGVKFPSLTLDFIACQDDLADERRQYSNEELDLTVKWVLILFG